MSHVVVFDLPTRQLGKSDVHFLVKRNRRVLGKLEVSKGAIVWYPKNHRFGHKISWRELDSLAKEYPKRERRKPRR
jgi:hypothetical protein